MVRILIVIVAALAFARPGDVQYTIAGTWTVETADASGTLLLASKAGQLSGTWVDPEGRRWPFTGRLDASRFEFATEARQVEGEGTGGDAGRYRWTFSGDNDHDTLRGTLAYHRDGAEPDRTQPFIATRKK